MLKDSFILLYKSIERSSLEYANSHSVGWPCRKEDIEIIVRVQIRAMIVLFKCITRGDQSTVASGPPWFFIYD
jgi:hypothetical protein